MADKSKSIMKKPEIIKSEAMDIDEIQSNESDGETEHGMRVGEEYQALVPGLIIDKDKYEPSHKALLVWSPNAHITDEKLDEYLQRAKDKHGYNMEQALGMLFWHKHNIDRSLTDLANFTPFPDEWSMEDKVLFEQAFNSHGKSFKKLQQSLQDKSISSLVKFYYSWKKTRSRTSLIDRQAKRVSLQRDQSDNDSDKSDTSDSDFEPEKEGRANGGLKRSLPGKQNPPPQIVPASICANCGTQAGQMHTTPKGIMCNACYQFWRRTGIMRSRSSNHAKSDSHNARSQGKGKRKPPKGMTITQESLLIVSGLHSNAHLRPLDMDIINLKRQIQTNKQNISQDRFDLQVGINDVRGLEPSLKNNARWSNEELTLAVQSVRRYGKDFQAMADVLQNKTVSQCRNFYVNHRKRYDLEQVLEDYETEQGIVRTDKKDGDQVPSPDSGGSSVPSPGTAAQGNPPPLTKPSLVSTQSMFSNPTPYRNNVPSTGLSVPPPPLIKPTPMNYPVQVLLPSGVSSPPPQLVSQDSPYVPPHSGTTPPLRPTKV